jgi:hypothetical protein
MSDISSWDQSGEYKLRVHTVLMRCLCEIGDPWRLADSVVPEKWDSRALIGRHASIAFRTCFDGSGSTETDHFSSSV